MERNISWIRGIYWIWKFHRSFSRPRSVAFPLAKPGIVLATIFNIFGIWNEYILAYVLISDAKLRTLPVGLATILVKQYYSANYGKLFAAIVIALMPVAVIYIIFQRKLTGGLLAGGLKE